MKIIKLENNNGELTTTSLEIARVTEKNHKRVLEDIRAELGVPKTGPSYYKNSQNKKQPMYTLSERETLQLMSRYSKEVRKMVIDEFFRMKEYISSQQPSKMSTLDVLKIATAEIEKLEQENKTLALTNETQSKQLDVYLKFGDNIGLREFTKRIYTTNSIDWSESRVKSFIIELGMLITSNKSSWNAFRPYAGKYQEYFLVKSTEQEFGGKIRTQLLITPHGQAHIVDKILEYTGILDKKGEN